MAEQIISASGTQYGLVINNDGSINVVIPNPITISGNIIIGSVSASVDSIYIQSGANIDLGSAWTTVGSVYVTNYPNFYLGSKVYQGDIFGISGTVEVSNLYTGSNSWISNFTDLGSNVVVTNLYTGSKVYQGEVFGVSGDVIIRDSLPNSIYNNNPAFKFEYDSNNNLGSVTQFIGAGSYVNVITYQGYSGTSIGIGSRILNVGSYF